jgi:hypothetical protein
MTELMDLLSKISRNLTLFMLTIDVAIIICLLVLLLSVTIFVMVFRYVRYRQNFNQWLNDRVNRFLFYTWGGTSVIVGLVVFYSLSHWAAAPEDNIQILQWALWVVWFLVAGFYWPVFLVLLVLIIFIALKTRQAV